MYKVKDIAKLLDMSEHTVRYYTDMGLVPSLKRDKNGTILFDEQSKNWLVGIKNLRGSGMPIQGVNDYVNLCLQGESTNKLALYFFLLVFLLTLLLPFLSFPM